MPVKDYYKILEVLPAASQQEIKRAYRRLAQVYHPDKTGGNPAAEAYFREVKEAYEVLSDPAGRETYNFQRWHMRSMRRKYDSPAFSPQTILLECIAIREYIDSIDIFRMNQEALEYQLKNILSNSNLSLLQQCKDYATNSRIVEEVLSAAGPLHYRFTQPLIQRLTALAESDPGMIEMIQKYALEKASEKKWNTYKIILIVFITILLCALIYSLGK
jgi:molecular chaperone DnaJ